MRHADLYTGAGKLRDALKTLRAQWEDVSGDWNDAVRHEFERSFMEVIEPQTLSAIEAVGHLAEVLSRAEHECS
jgi:hypothetical protein